MAKKKDRYEFIWQAIQVHGYRDDLREVDYKGSNKEIQIICPKHGRVKLIACNYLKGCKCKQCATEEAHNKFIMPFKEFLEKANTLYNNFYEYDESTYKSTQVKMRIICPIHGEFWQLPYNHLRGVKCKFCSIEENAAKARNSIEKFIENGKKIHKYENGEPLYDYSKSKQPKNNKERSIIVICKKHGEFFTSYNAHISHKKGCPICGMERLYEKSNNLKIKAANEFMEKAFKIHNINGEYKYNYDKVIYNGVSNEVCIVCPKHGDFWQTPGNHLQGHGCPICAIEEKAEKLKMTYEEFMKKISKIHINYNGELLYDYSKVNYVDLYTEICVICKKHGEFWIKPYVHLYSKCGCKKCNYSKLENEISDLLQLNDIKYIYEKKFEWLGLKTLDFYLEDYNIAIECQGLQHFKPIEWFGGEDGFKKIIERDELKRKLCEENGVKLLYFSNLGIEYPYQVFENKEELLKKIINNKKELII